MHTKQSPRFPMTWTCYRCGRCCHQCHDCYCNELCPDCVEGNPVPEKVHLCDSCKRITIDRRPDLAEDIA